MNTNPGMDGMLEGVIVGIANELIPFLSNEKAVATAMMMQSLLQGVRQTLPVYDSYLVLEHNDMTSTLRTAAAALDGVAGEEAARVRERGATLGALADLPAPPDSADVARAYNELGRALEANIADLDVIQRGGGADATAADTALDAVRAHLAPRYLRDFSTFTIAGGFVGRS